MFLLISELQGGGHKGLSKVTAVGISIGSFVFGLLLCMVLCYYRQKKSRQRRRHKQGNTMPLKSFENQAYSKAPQKS